MVKTVRIVGIGTTKLGRLGRSATELAIAALNDALADAGMTSNELQGFIAVPSLSNPHFMQAHHLATAAGLLPRTHMTVRTIDTGGAGPISAIATANNMIRSEWAETVAIVASDAVLSLDNKEFAQRADNSVAGSNLPSPAIPHGYDAVAQWQMAEYGVTREQLAMVPVIMSHLACRHPDALCRKPFTLEQVMNSPKIAPVTNLLECARRADGAAALIVTSSKHWERKGFAKDIRSCPTVISCGEGSGALYPVRHDPKDPTSAFDISENMFSCERACNFVYESTQLSVDDIDFFGLYDCFPICFLRALEAVRLCPRGQSGKWIEEKYMLLQKQGSLSPNDFPINTHGGLQCFGAPWEVPAMYNVIEAVRQLRGEAAARQITPRPRKALVYGNGGIFSASSVAILGSGGF
jgi:acetyl-CoA acetyltransferase